MDTQIALVYIDTETILQPTFVGAHALQCLISSPDSLHAALQYARICVVSFQIVGLSVTRQINRCLS